MKKSARNIGILLILIGGLISISLRSVFNDIPKTWDLGAIKRFHLPPPDSTVQVSYASEEYYYAVPEHVIYKTYPVYYREFEKPGYVDSLRKLNTEIVFDATSLKTQEDWIKAGELVFNWPAVFNPFNGNTSSVTAAGSSGKIPTDGAYLFNRYILKDGKLQVGSLSCASCHTKVLDNGDVIPGAQGNVFNNVGFINSILSGKIPFPILQEGARRLSFTPWAPTLKNNPSSPGEFAELISTTPAGINDRQGTAYSYPVAVPSLIGIKDIRYLDRTGLMKHDEPADIMRYAAFNQGMDMLTTYDDYTPAGKNDQAELPAPSQWNHPFGYAGARYSDAQLYALTQYIYSLKPPKNPEQFPQAQIAKGQQVFIKSGCITCHTPPLYTNNKLTPVNGFEPPASHFKKYDIFNVSVETDSVSALYSRRGTGYYKVPSLRGVWMQSAFFHNGNLASLEEVLDPKRVDADYVPKGFKPPQLKTMAVKGHAFGFDLSEQDKKALIAFLKTL